MSKINRKEWARKASRAQDLAEFHRSRAQTLTEVLENTRARGQGKVTQHHKRHSSSAWLYVVLGILAALYALVQIVLPALGG